MKIRNILLASLLSIVPPAGLFCVGGTSESGNSRSVIVGSIVNVNGTVGNVVMKLVAEGYVPGADTSGKVFSARTDCSGNYRFEEVPRGYYYLNSRVPGKKLLRGPIEIAKPEVDLAADSLCGTAQVTMRLPDTGNVNVVFLKGSTESWTVSTKTIVLDSLPAGDITVVGFAKNGDVPQTLSTANSIQLSMSMAPADTVKAAFNNAPPVIVTEPGYLSRSVLITDSAYKAKIIATDPENGALRFQVISAPAGMFIDSLTGTIIWQPAGSVVGGIFRIGVQVADMWGSTRSIWWSITVVESYTQGPDTLEPAITLIGSDSIRILVGQTFVDPGATAFDARDGDISNRITISGVVNVAAAGTYVITYSVKDKAGNSFSIRRIVMVAHSVLPPDTVAPVITLLGSPEMNLVLGAGGFVDPGYTATDNVDGNIRDNVIVTGRIYDIMIGTDTIYYNVADAAGNKAKTGIRVVHVVAPDTTVDTWPPEIKLLGKVRDTIRVGETWTEPGYVVWDNQDTNGMGAKVVVTITSAGGAVVPAVTTATETFFRLQYAIQDSAGNSGDVKQRIVVVIAGGTDPVLPVILLLGSPRCSVAVNAHFSDPGAIASDSNPANPSRVDLTGSIKRVFRNSAGAVVDSSTFTQTPGLYSVTYSVTDAAGNKAADVTRTVSVRDVTVSPPDTGAPIILLLGKNPDTLVVGSVYDDPGATAVDVKDGLITANIVKTGTVNVATIGEYTLTYSVTNSAGEPAMATRKVVVVSGQ